MQNCKRVICEKRTRN